MAVQVRGDRRPRHRACVGPELEEVGRALRRLDPKGPRGRVVTDWKKDQRGHADPKAGLQRRDDRGISKRGRLTHRSALALAGIAVRPTSHHDLDGPLSGDQLQVVWPSGQSSWTGSRERNNLLGFGVGPAPTSATFLKGGTREPAGGGVGT